MTSQKIGNWLINEDGIDWAGKENIDYNIDRKSLLKIGFADRKGMYDWLIQLSEKTWVSVEDIITLNAAFVIAAKEYNLVLDIDVLASTMEDQLGIIKKRDEWKID